MLIDAGLFQGLKELRERNWHGPAGRPVRDRRGRAHARASRSRGVSAAARGAAGTAAGSSARRARRISAGSCCPTRAASRKRTRPTPTARATRSTSPALPLYGEADAMRALTLLQPVGYDRPVPVVGRRRGGLHQRRPPARFVVRADPGGRSGRCSSAVTSAGSTGRCFRIRRWSREADYLLVESTYGDRVHDTNDDGARAGARSSGRRSAAAAA